jgi:hypothetical protein
MPDEIDESFDEEEWAKNIIKSATEGFRPQPKPRNSTVIKINQRTKQPEIIQYTKRSMIP